MRVGERDRHNPEVGVMDLAALHERGLAEGGAHRFPQGLRPVENGQETAIGAQPATLEIGE